MILNHKEAIEFIVEMAEEVLLPARETLPAVDPLNKWEGEWTEPSGTMEEALLVALGVTPPTLVPAAVRELRCDSMLSAGMKDAAALGSRVADKNSAGVTNADCSPASVL